MRAPAALRVLVATGHTYPPQRVGGSESSMHGICVQLARQGAEVAVLAGWSPFQAGGLRYLARAATSRGPLVVDAPAGYPVFRARDPAAAVADAVAAFRPDVAVVNSGVPLRLAPLFTAAGVPTAVYLRDVLYGEWGGRPEPPGDADGGPRIAYVTTSRALAESYAAEFRIAAARVPPMVAPEAYRTETARRTVTFVCPVPAKGLDTALALARRRPDIPFDFVEGWPIKPWRRAARDRKIRLHGNVTLHPRTQDMRGVYARARLVLVPSPTFEGWGRVVSEAQVSGIPALASTVGGLPEAVGPGGLLVDPAAGPDAWAEALGRLWDDPAEYARLSQAALAHAQRPEFTPDALGEQLMAVLQALVR